MSEVQAETANETVREAVGVFVDAPRVRRAMDDLLAAGFDRDEIGLLASQRALGGSLDEYYALLNDAESSEEAPDTKFVKRESVGEATRSSIGGLTFVGTSAVGGIIVASAAVLGGGLVAAISGAAAVGAVGAVLAMFIHESDAEELEEQVDQGHLLLFVRTPNEAAEKRALEIFARHEPIDSRCLSVPASQAV